jgi:cell division protease FtsH
VASRTPRSSRSRFLPFVALAVLALLVGAFLLRRGDSPEKLTLDEFEELVLDGRVETATIKDRDHTVVGELDDGREYKVAFPAEFGDELTDLLRQAEPPIELDTDQQHEPVWLNVLVNLLPILLLFGLILFLMNSVGGVGSRAMQFGRSKAKRLTGDEPKATFADVAGCEEAVEELEEIRDFLADPDRFRAIGATIPKGVLLYGPPGTGKTLLARAVAGEAGVPFFTISGSDFVEMFVGVGASRVRDLFGQAKQAAPAIVFVDEIDAVGRHRGSGFGGGHDEREQTLNQLLVEMDGFDASAGVILIAATNRPDILDPALLRPGRFDRQIVVDRPDLVGRRAILEVHARGKPLGAGVSLDVLARRTPGFTGADLANLLNEAALLTARRGLPDIGMPECEEAIDRVIAGPERKTRVLSEHEKSVIAYHEAGHALVGHALPGTDPIHKVSIIARGRALGWTLALPTEDRVLRTRSELRDELTMLLGGRSAEELVFGDPTTGAQNDIEKATQIARAMVTEWGMSESLGPRQLGAGAGESPPVHPGAAPTSEHGDELSSQIDDEVRALIDTAHAEARDILVTHRAILDRLAAALVERETLEAEELIEVFEGVSHVTNRPSTSPRPRLVEPVVAAVDEPVRVPAGASAAVRAARGRSLRRRLAGWLEPGAPTT